MNKKICHIEINGKDISVSSQDYYAICYYAQMEEIADIAKRVGKKYQTVHTSINRWKKKNADIAKELDRERVQIEKKSMLMLIAEMANDFTREELGKILKMKGFTWADYEEGKKLLAEMGKD